MTDSQTGTYGAVSRANHWIVSLAVFGMLAVGFYLANVELPRETRGPIMNLHKATGTLLLFVIAWRVIWRLRQGFPAPVPGVAAWEITASRLVHWGLLACTVLMPLSGASRSLLGGRPIDIYGLFAIPPVGKVEGFSDIAGLVHTVTAYTLAILIVLHIAAALKHQFVDKDATLARMLTGKSAGA
ncbi:MAG: cytochrome b [Hyphomonas sp.]|nr:cytochrome b [Hyphomonas sp.]